MTAGTRPSLARATGVMALGTALSRLTGFGRNIALAIFIGRNLLSDTYNLANITPNIIYELLLGGVLSATLVPLFVELWQRIEAGGAEAGRAWHDLSAVVTLAVVASVAATIVFVLAAPLIVGLYFNEATADQRAIGTGLVRLFGMQVAAYGVIAVTTALLTARRRFAAPMFAPIANNLVVIAVIVALPRVAASLDVNLFRHDGRAIAFLGLGTTLGVLVMAAVQVARLPAAGFGRRRASDTRREGLTKAPSDTRRHGLTEVPTDTRRQRLTHMPIEAVHSLRPVWDLRSPGVRRLVGLSGWTLGVVAANQAALLVVSRLAIGRAGAYSAYTVALVFFLLPHGIYAVSVITALQPDLAERWLARDLAGLGARVATGLRTIMAVIVPAAVGLALVASPVVQTLLQHGRFDAEDARVTAATLACLALGLPGFSGFLFLTRVWQSMQNTRMTFLLYLVENAVNIAAAVVLFPRFGVQGLAAAYGTAYTVAAATALVVLSRRLPTGWLAGTATFALRLLGATAALAVAAALTMAGVGSIVPGGAVRAAAQVALTIPVGAAAFLAAAAAVGLTEPQALIQPLLRRLRR